MDLLRGQYVFLSPFAAKIGRKPTWLCVTPFRNSTSFVFSQGSYGGARAAHMRVLYPDIVFGAISSSGVTHATLTDWRYADIIRQYAPQACIARIEKAIDEVDTFLADNKTSGAIKAVFGLGEVSYNPDFASVLLVRVPLDVLYVQAPEAYDRYFVQGPLGDWQGKNWDPDENDDGFSEFCDALGPVDNATVKAQGLTISNATAVFASYINQV